VRGRGTSDGVNHRLHTKAQRDPERQSPQEPGPQAQPRPGPPPSLGRHAHTTIERRFWCRSRHVPP
jgi:hypothetical protein